MRDADVDVARVELARRDLLERARRTRRQRARGDGRALVAQPRQAILDRRQPREGRV